MPYLQAELVNNGNTEPEAQFSLWDALSGGPTAPLCAKLYLKSCFGKKRVCDVH